MAAKKKPAAKKAPKKPAPKRKPAPAAKKVAAKKRMTLTVFPAPAVERQDATVVIGGVPRTE